MCLNALDKLVEGGSSLKGTGGQYGSDSFRPAAAVFAASLVIDVAVDGHEADGLFGEVVGGFKLWRGDELDGVRAVFPQTFGNTLGIARGRNAALTFWTIFEQFQLTPIIRACHERVHMRCRDGCRIKGQSAVFCMAGLSTPFVRNSHTMPNFNRRHTLR